MKTYLVFEVQVDIVREMLLLDELFVLVELGGSECALGVQHGGVLFAVCLQQDIEALDDFPEILLTLGFEQAV